MTDSLSVHRNLIGGEWVDGGTRSENINPSNTDDIVGIYAQGDAAAVDAAAEAARAALPAWRDSTPQARADLLEQVGLALMARKDEVGRLLAREEGKTLAEATGEAVRAAQIFKFYAGEALRVTGEAIASLRAGVDVEVVREPVGVVGLITPWNFPIAIPAWKAAPALAYGNSVILKPADLTPGCAHLLAELLGDTGCPPGVFNLVCGSGDIVGQALVDHPRIDAISFTGSVPIGRTITARAARTMKKLQLEMGGKNPLVVLDDADLDLAVTAALNGAFFATGQRCTASSRLIVQAGIHDAFVDRLTMAMAALRVGDALDPASQIGPVVSQSQLDSNLGYIALARQEGAEVIGGEPLDRATPGFYQAPALFIGADNGMRIAREEIFGPCATVIKVDNFDEALATAQDSDFGLSAAIFTANLKHAREFKRRSTAGMVMVNLPTAGVDYHVPFGGRKASSYGPREQGRHAVDFYTTLKTSYTFAG